MPTESEKEYPSLEPERIGYGEKDGKPTQKP